MWGKPGEDHLVVVHLGDGQVPGWVWVDGHERDVRLTQQSVTQSIQLETKIIMRTHIMIILTNNNQMYILIMYFVIVTSNPITFNS